ncbi:NeuD/PglB/VioB family sugar acetyltransferase [Vibrio sp. D420a]|uniref:NeuD/PglB/VioB family sugar acetyltransferase n=1 Tax=Vibrio sp. D420a TaxID=2836895 RepID=UPI0025560412|nr:NeuD/PglB/VioB family sugar acetyltransferase [Vibrio sp. D420a]MDK9762815.1 NeuD/PglB/VioB family sugar acetyltransferase [Vibrio sp. D420a]
MKDLILIGGGGHCTSCIDVIESQGQYQIRGILDSSDKVGTSVAGYPISDTDDALATYVQQGCHFLITIGHIHSSAARERIYSQLINLNAPLATVVSPRAHLARTAQVGAGVIVMHDALINANAKVGDNCIINSKALVEHDAQIAAHCHVSTGAVINGGAHIETSSFVGSNAVVVQGVQTPTQAFIKAGRCYAGERQPSVGTKTVVLTTIFPVKEAYVHDYFNSLVRQSVQGFDVVLVNDGFGDLSALKAQYPQLNIIELESAGSIVKNREHMCQFALNNQYGVAIFADIDDYFSDNRVAHSLRLLEDYDVVVNDLTSFNETAQLQSRILSTRVADGDEITLDFIRDKNLCGLSNTAIRLTGLASETLRFPSDLVAVDWYLFSTLLCQSKRAVFTNQAVTYYRQHQSNTVGIGRINIETIRQSLQVRSIHYQNMLAVNTDYQTDLDANQQLIARFNHPDECAAILEINQTNNYTPLWWEVIAK